MFLFLFLSNMLHMLMETAMSLQILFSIDVLYLDCLRQLNECRIYMFFWIVAIPQYSAFGVLVHFSCNV